MRTSRLVSRPTQRYAFPAWLSQASLRQLVAKHAHLWSFLFGVAICGLMFGAIVAGQMGETDKLVLGNALEELLNAIKNNSLATGSDLWLQRAISDGELIGCVWLFGVSVIGIPFVVAVVFYKAFTVGFGIAYTTLQFGWRGVLISSVGIFAHQLIILFTLFIAAGTAIRFSQRILAQSLPISELTIQFVRYTGTFVLCSGGIMLGAFVQAFMVPHLLIDLMG